MSRLLMVITGANRLTLKDGTIRPTGLWAEEVVVPHLDAAFNYARWLTKSEADAEDVVQDATVRALRFFPSLRNEWKRSPRHFVHNEEISICESESPASSNCRRLAGARLR